MKQAAIYLYNRKAGLLTEDETGYTFRYDADYLRLPDAEAVRHCRKELENRQPR